MGDTFVFEKGLVVCGDWQAALLATFNIFAKRIARDRDGDYIYIYDCKYTDKLEEIFSKFNNKTLRVDAFDIWNLSQYFEMTDIENKDEPSKYALPD